jgi:hypothetical protein
MSNHFLLYKGAYRDESLIVSIESPAYLTPYRQDLETSYKGVWVRTLTVLPCNREEVWKIFQDTTFERRILSFDDLGKRNLVSICPNNPLILKP